MRTKSIVVAAQKWDQKGWCSWRRCHSSGFDFLLFYAEGSNLGLPVVTDTESGLQSEHNSSPATSMIARNSPGIYADVSGPGPRASACGPTCLP